MKFTMACENGVCDKKNYACGCGPILWEDNKTTGELYFCDMSEDCPHQIPVELKGDDRAFIEHAKGDK